MAAASLANKYSAFNAILLSFFAVAIPGVFGSAATYLIGRGTMEAGIAAMAEGLYFMQRLGGMVAGGLAGGLSRFGGSIGRIAGTATRMGTNLVRSGVGGVREFIKDRQYTRELHKSELGGIAKDFGIRMRRSTPEEIERSFRSGDFIIQSKGDGVIGIYDRNFNFRGIRDQDGSYRGVGFLSEEERNRYGNIDFNRDFGVIDTRTGNFVQGRFDGAGAFVSPIPTDTNNRIGRIQNTNFLDILHHLQ
jgi:hypothetical protein